MKIRTKIVLISSIAVLTAAFLVNAMVLWMTSKSWSNEAYAQAYQNSFVVMSEAEEGLDLSGSEVDKARLEYYFKTYRLENNQRDFYTVCIQEDTEGEGRMHYEEIYNHTIFSPQKLMSQTYTDCEDKMGIMYCSFEYGGGKYLIFRKSFAQGVEIFRIEDVTYVQQQAEQLAVSMGLSTLGIMAVMVLFLYLILKRLLKPLQELNETAGQMAEGVYDRRVEIHTPDEIGQLGESFNRMAEAVEMRTRSLEESEKRKTLFMGNLTHELKTPMTAISGYAQMLLSMKLTPEDQEEALHYIYEECNRLERLSKKMMKLLELDQDTELTCIDISAERLFEAAGKACQVILKEKQITLECIQQGEHFQVDPDLMTDVLINLIDNGVKASEPGSKIILRAGENYIEVQDFGRGIPQEEQEKILEPFYMIDKSRSRKSGGAGLGLALTAMIVKRHNVSLRIESKEGEGSRMILQFV